MTILGHPGGQRSAVRPDAFVRTIAYLVFFQGSGHVNRLLSFFRLAVDHTDILVHDADLPAGNQLYKVCRKRFRNPIRISRVNERILLTILLF